jgi:multidrug efflux pump subunit AcrA (membrane-fusion protein)
MQKSKIKNQNHILKFKNFAFCIVILIFAFCILNFSVGCQKNEAAKMEGPQVIPVKVSKVELKDLADILEYVGDIKAKDEAVVYPKVSGKIIEKIKQDGDPVNKGEAIAYIDRDEVGLKYEKAPVESPLSGTVGRVYIAIGENVTSQTAVALVVDMDKVKISLDIPEKYLPKISLGQEAVISTDAYPKDEFSGSITKVSPVVNLENRAAPVEIIIDNKEHRLKSGMFAKVNLVVEKHAQVPVVFKESIIGKEPDLYVFVIEDNKAALKKIALGIRQGPYYEVTDGLEAGELVVIVGQQRLTDGAPVRVEMENNND